MTTLREIIAEQEALRMARVGPFMDAATARRRNASDFGVTPPEVVAAQQPVLASPPGSRVGRFIDEAMTAGETVERRTLEPTGIPPARESTRSTVSQAAAVAIHQGRKP